MNFRKTATAMILTMGICLPSYSATHMDYVVQLKQDGQEIEELDNLNFQKSDGTYVYHSSDLRYSGKSLIYPKVVFKPFRKGFGEQVCSYLGHVNFVSFETYEENIDCEKTLGCYSLGDDNDNIYFLDTKLEEEDEVSAVAQFFGVEEFFKSGERKVKTITCTDKPKSLELNLQSF